MEAASAGGTPILAREAAEPARATMIAAEAEQHPIDGDARCACCRRFPLVGEKVTGHEGRHGHEWACETCESAGRAERLGRVTGRDRIRTLGGAANVRRAA